MKDFHNACSPSSNYDLFIPEVIIRVTIGPLRESVPPLLFIDDKHKLRNVVITVAFIIGKIRQGRDVSTR